MDRGREKDERERWDRNIRKRQKKIEMDRDRNTEERERKGRIETGKD